MLRPAAPDAALLGAPLGGRVPALARELRAGAGGLLRRGIQFEPRLARHRRLVQVLLHPQPAPRRPRLLPPSPGGAQPDFGFHTPNPCGPTCGCGLPKLGSLLQPAIHRVRHGHSRALRRQRAFDAARDAGRVGIFSRAYKGLADDVVRGDVDA